AHGVQLPEQDCRPGCSRPTVPSADASVPTLAGERLVPQTGLENTCRYKFGVNITEKKARSEASRKLRLGGTSRGATPPGRVLLDPWWSPQSWLFFQLRLTRRKAFGSMA